MARTAQPEPRRTPVLLVVAAGTAVTTATALAAGTMAAAAADKAQTSLSIRSAKSDVRPGNADRISGALIANGRGPLAGKTVALKARPSDANSFQTVDTATTGDNGRVVFVVHPGETTRYVLVFTGDDNDQRARSGVVRVAVTKRAPTTLSIRLAQRVIQPGDSDTIRGDLRSEHHGLANRRIVLQSRVPGAHWSRAAVARTGEHGFVQFLVTPADTTRYRLVFHGNDRRQPTRSGVVTVHVQQPSSLSIRLALGEVSEGESDVISGGLQGDGHGLRGRLVHLMERPTGTTTWTEVDSARTNKNGHVAFTVTPPAGQDDYQLAFAGGPNFAACQSGVVTVTVD
jgi:hypothetical protein